MPDKLSLSQFGQKIKTKYPQYNSLSDEDLGTKVLQKYPEYADSVDLTPPAQPGIRDRIDSALAPKTPDGLIGQLREAAKGAVAGTIAPVLHPMQTVEQLGQGVMAGGSTPYGAPINAPTGNQKIDAENEQAQASAREDMAQQGKELASHPAYTAGAVIGPLLATHAVRKLAPKIGELRSRAANNVRGFAQENLDAGEEFARKTTEKYGKDVEGTKQQNQTATEKTLKDRGKVDEKNRVTGRKDARDTARVKERNERAVAEHARKLREVVEHNRSLEQSGQAQETIGGQINEHSQELDSRIQKAKVKAKGANDKEWATVREKIGDAFVPANDLAGDVRAAESKLKGSAESIKVFRDILSHEAESTGMTDDGSLLINDGDIAVRPGTFQYESLKALYDANPELNPGSASGTPIPFKDLHGYYSELGTKISQGNLPGDVYQAMKSLRDSIGKRMQGLADAKGAGSDLTKAKEGFQKYMEAFSDSPTTKQTVASKVLSEATPDYVKERDQAARLEKVSQYDSEIAATANRIRGLRGQLKNLPTGGPKPLPEAPRLETMPPASERTPYAEPHSNDATPQAPDITEERRTQLQDKLKKYGRVGSWVGRVIFGGIAAAASHGDISRFSTDLVLGQGAMTILTNALQSESVLEWLAKPSPKDIEVINQLPPDQAVKMRQALTGLAQEDLRRNPKLTGKIAPALASFMGASNVGQPVKNRKEAMDLLQPAQ